MEYKKIDYKLIGKNLIVIANFIEKYPLPFILLVYFAFAFYKLDEIPGEWYGDISNVHEYVSLILNGKWPFFFFQSSGPVYHYLITPLIFFIGSRYIQYKIASVLVGAMFVVAIYKMADMLSGKLLAFLSATIASISFWTIVWARTGNSQILIPALTSVIVYSVEKYTKESKYRYLIPGMISSSFALFTYPQAFILPVFLLFWLAARKKWSAIMISTTSLLPAFMIFRSVVISEKDNFAQGYVGSKIPRLNDFLNLLTYKKFLINLLKTIKMFHFEGDVSFRVNISKFPQLDIISGVLLIAGIYYWWKNNRKLLLILLFSIFFLLLPSMSPSLPPVEVPNSGRTITIIPFILFLVASGILYVYKLFRSKEAGAISIPIILIVIALLNFYKYFWLYPNNLPNKNVPFGKIISNYIDVLPTNPEVKLTSCCWGEWGQPEPKAIYYNLKNRTGRENIISDFPFLSECGDIKDKRNLVIIFDPNDFMMIDKFKECAVDKKFTDFNYKDQRVFSSLYLD